MILFADKSKYIHSPTERRDWSLAGHRRLHGDGGTALYDALYDSLAQVDGVKGRRVVVVVTDGRDENAASNGPGSLRTWEDVLRSCSRSKPRSTRWASGHAWIASAAGARRPVRRRRILPHRRDRARRRLPEDPRRTPPPLRRRLRVDQPHAQRTMAKGGDSRARSDVTVRSRDGYFAPAQ